MKRVMEAEGTNRATAAGQNIRQICQNIAKYPSDFPKFQPKFSTGSAANHAALLALSGRLAPRTVAVVPHVALHVFCLAHRRPQRPLPALSTLVFHFRRPPRGSLNRAGNKPAHTHSDSVTKSMGTHGGWQCPHRLKYASHTRATVGGMMDPGLALTSLSTIRPVAGSLSATLMERHSCVFDQLSSYLLRAILMSTWGFLPAVFRPLRTVFPGLGAGFLNLGGKTEGTAKKRGKNGKKWARNGLKRVGVS